MSQATESHCSHQKENHQSETAAPLLPPLASTDPDEKSVIHENNTASSVLQRTSSEGLEACPWAGAIMNVVCNHKLTCDTVKMILKESQSDQEAGSMQCASCARAIEDLSQAACKKFSKAVRDDPSPKRCNDCGFPEKDSMSQASSFQSQTEASPHHDQTLHRRWQTPEDERMIGRTKRARERSDGGGGGSNEETELIDSDDVKDLPSDSQSSASCPSSPSSGPVGWAGQKRRKRSRSAVGYCNKGKRDKEEQEASVAESNGPTKTDQEASDQREEWKLHAVTGRAPKVKTSESLHGTEDEEDSMEDEIIRLLRLLIERQQEISSKMRLLVQHHKWRTTADWNNLVMEPLRFQAEEAGTAQPSWSDRRHLRHQTGASEEDAHQRASYHGGTRTTLSQGGHSRYRQALKEPSSPSCCCSLCLPDSPS
eukprot:80438-Hanusia_phi.AAC.2